MLSLDYYLHSLLLVSILRGVICENLIALQKEGFSPEGSTVTLSYRYSKEAAGNDYFFWYRQYPGEPPEFLLSISGLNFTKKAESLKSDTRFFTDLSEGKKRVDLQISSAAVTDWVSCEDLTALQKEGFSPEGSTVTLSYRYSKEAAGNHYFFWYRQYPGEPPEFLLSISAVNFTKKAESLKSDTRFFTDLSEGKKRVDLQISSAAVTDSAVYYWVSCGNLIALQKEAFSPEGSTVTLSYRYSKEAAGTDYFFWYRQYPGEPPEFLLSISGVNFTKKAESLKSDTRFFTELSEGKKRVDLQISSAAVTDCAVFYCAVEPTVTGNTNTLYKNLWSKDNTILPNILQREFFTDLSEEKKRVDLSISSAAVTDSAVFYCAVRPTVTGNTTTLFKNTS
ncbi:hypothetical protein NQZ68_038590 [Dissostichus eleginoides]|nr:hypothetical protein NQZ68_038590 [Dissostichus eleginoides]